MKTKAYLEMGGIELRSIWTRVAKLKSFLKVNMETGVVRYMRETT